MVTTFKCDILFWVVHRKKEQASNQDYFVLTLDFAIFIIKKNEENCHILATVPGINFLQLFKFDERKCYYLLSLLLALWWSD
jgi:hypothetical protein